MEKNIFREILIWWGVTSCSLYVHVIKNFLGMNTTLFSIEARSARDISGYAKFSNEHEVILLPGIRLQFVSNPMPHDSGLQVVHLQELPVCTIKIIMKSINFSWKTSV